MGGEVTSSVADPNGTRNPKPGTHFLATVPQPVRAPLAEESAFRRMVSSCVSTDQGFCLGNHGGRCFSDVSGSSVLNLDVSGP